MLDLTAELAELGDELLKAVEGVVLSGRYILGPNVEAFEAEAADYLGVEHAVGVNSGTDALVIGLRALGVGPGDEVITTGFSFFATAEAISNVGARPVFVDIEPDTFNIDPARVEAAITPRTRALVPVHLFGHPVEFDTLDELAQRHGLAVLEDAAQAFGAQLAGRYVGSLGAAAAFSFFPSKNLGACGDGGLLTTNDPEVAADARSLRVHGSGRSKYLNEQLGYNSRLDEIQAALLRVKLRHLDDFNARRRRAATAYASLLVGAAEIAVPGERAGAQHVYHQYTVRLPAPRRDAAREKLAAEQIASALYYPCPLDRLPPYAAGQRPLPEAERASAEVLSLPIGPCLAGAQIERVCAALIDAVRS